MPEKVMAIFCFNSYPVYKCTRLRISVMVYNEKFQMQSDGLHPTFHDMTGKFQEIVKKSGIGKGTCVVYLHLTTCSVNKHQCSHDKTYFGLEFLH